MRLGTAFSQEGEQDRLREEQPSGWGAMLLAHHAPDEYHRCLKVNLGKRRLLLCARCSGLYPMLALGLALQFVFPLAPAWYDWPWLYGPLLPFLFDWVGYRIGRKRGTNAWRVLSGLGLGLALSRALYLHIRSPWNRTFAWWCLLLAAFVVMVELLRWAGLGRREA